jgi:hypothetical protein
MRTALLAAFVLCVATTSAAQEPPSGSLTGRFYISGGTGLAWRHAGDQGAITLPERTVVPTFSMAVGVRVGQRGRIEGVLGASLGQQVVPDPWFYTYPSGRDYAISTTTRDIPMLGLIRITPPCVGRLCLEPVLGAGFNHHNARSLTVAVCQPDGARAAENCPAVTDAEAQTDSSFEFVFAFGLDAPVRVSNRVSIGPTFGIMMIKRRDDLIEPNHRGPEGTSAIVPTLGVNLTWHSR